VLSSTAKLNAAYASGGAVTAVATIQQQIGLGIDKYALINMNGLKDLVDAVGGIEVDNKLGKQFRLKKLNLITQQQWNQVSSISMAIRH
jgi:LCP family protein required for cell wall assembly